MKITSTQNEFIKHLVKLNQKKVRDHHHELLIEGEHLIEEAKAANLVKKTLGLEEADIIIDEIVAKKLSRTQSGSTQFALIKKPTYDFVFGTRILVCDGVQDPGNVGTMIRSAHSFGFDMVILSPDCADAYNDKTIRATQGAIFSIPVHTMDLKQAYETLKKWQIKIYASDVNETSSTLSDVNKNEACAIVMGSEGSGVSNVTKTWADDTLFIETNHFESLNVAVASGIILYVLRK
ncbi:MAG TPA: RNA methyltransferase [Erysipelothrix sp.]|nr:RNA methyltransferase [Erysipelothrix sp.]